MSCDINELDQNRQWEKDGDCNICMREKYCKKNCKAHTDAVDRKLRGLVFEYMLSKTSQIKRTRGSSHNDFIR